jgi:pimeloyl-ACP methyl ester carboxylesterase
MRFPYAEVEFTSTGALHDEAQQRTALDTVRQAEATDVLVLAHGWNNDMSAARRLFEQLTDNLAAVMDQVPGATDRRIAVIGVLWPSVRWADDDELAGGGAGVADEENALRLAIRQSVDDPAKVAQLEELIPRLERSATARQEFLDLLRERLPQPRDDDEDPPPSALIEGDAEQVFDDASTPDTDFGDATGTGGAAAGGPSAGGGASFGSGAPNSPHHTEVGGAAGFGFGGILRGARTLLNLTTYYTMKARAGDVGSKGVAGLLDALAEHAPDVRRHLAGHSFGARVVTAAAMHGPPVHTVALLQGAFSHHGLAEDYDGKGNDGFFRAVLAPELNITGPLLITHTGNDRAVGVAYAVASRLARQRASGLGGPDDLYGGIGRNGALNTPEVVTPAGELLDVGQPYELIAGQVHNLRADRFIGSHSAVTGQEVAYALLSGIMTPAS